MLLIRSRSLAQLLGIELYPKGDGEFIRVVIEAGGPDLWWPVVEGAKE